MSVINQSDIEHIDEALRKFANQKNMNGFAAILIGFTDEGDHTCLIAKGELNRVDMLYCFSKGIQLSLIHIFLKTIFRSVSCSSLRAQRSA